MPLTNNSEELITAQNQEDELILYTETARFTFRSIFSAIVHPFEYSRTLIQLGFEPLKPKPGKTIFRRDVLLLPNLFTYTGYLCRVDGFWGLYTGVGPKFVGSFLGLHLSDAVVRKLEMPTVDTNYKDEWDDEELYTHYKVSLKKDVVFTATNIIVSYPFHVISVRMMAQFIGREQIYKSLWSSIKEIYRNEGIGGFFAGLIPKLLGEIACVVLSSSAIYLINKYVIKDCTSRKYNAAIIQFTVTGIFYPLHVVSTCMAVTGARLVAGQPPFMPLYCNWIECFNDLQLRGALKRGNSMFWRSVPVGGGHFTPKLTKFF